MKVDYHRNFIKNYDKRIAPDLKLAKKFEERLRIFRDNPDDPRLHNHKLISEDVERWAFSVTGDIRAVYFRDGDFITFYDIGSHNQVY